MKISLNKKGYNTIRLSKYCVTYTFNFYRLVAEHFVPCIENRNVVNHINGIKTDNRAINLEWINHRENLSHYFNSVDTRSNFIGSDYNKKLNKWRAHIRISNKNNHLGYFATPELAHQEYLKALTKFGLTNKYSSGNNI